MIKKFIGNLIFFLFGLISAFITFNRRSLFSMTNEYDIYKTLSDGFFLPAVILVGFGLLVFVSNAGFFDIFAYSFRSIKEKLKKEEDKDPSFPPTYYDYKEKYSGKKLNIAKPLISGCIFLMLSLGFCLLFLYK